MENRIIVILFLLFLVSLSFFCGCATTRGTLDISSTPSGAWVFLDGEYRGLTPLTLTDVSPGTHTVELRLSGYKIWTTSGTMEGGGSAKVEASLDPVSSPTPPPTPATVITSVPSDVVVTTTEPIQTGTLIVASKPSSADVYVNSVYRGKTPLMLKEIPVGTYEIKVSNAGYADWSGEATVSWTGTTTISVSLSVIPPTTTAPPTTPAPWTPPPGSYILLNPIGDVNGEFFKISGTTNLEEMTAIFITVRDLQGNRVVYGSATVIDGAFEFPVDTYSWSSGIYTVEASAYGVTATQYVTVYH